MKIATIVSSNSHIDYVARIVDGLDSETPPTAEDYGFGQFVAIETDGTRLIGVIYDSRLINPEYAQYGPRLSPRPGLGSFSPDYLMEQGVLVSILLLGSAGDTRATQGVPRRVVPPGEAVWKLEIEEVVSFHTDADGSVRVHYFPQVVAHTQAYAVPLLETIVDTLLASCSASDRQRLAVLRESVKWQGTFGGLRL
jgi:hypothetical protein